MIIGIYTYDKYELCETILETTIGLARYVGCSLGTASATISKVKKHLIDYIVIDGRRKKIELIEE